MSSVNLLLIKALISILVVIGLAEISKRVNPVLGGILNGLPLATGLSVYFLAFEKGTAYILPGIPWGIASLGGSLSFCLAYRAIGATVRSVHRVAAIALSSLGGMVAFGVVGLVLRQLPLSLLTASSIFMALYVANLVVFTRRVSSEASRTEGKSSFRQLVFRSVLASGIIVTLTTLGGLFGSQWAGVLSSFPSTLFALLVVLHYEEGSEMVTSVVHGFSFSIFVLLVFYWLCAAILPILNLNTSYLIIYGICAVFLVLFNKLAMHRPKLITDRSSSAL